jgi:S-adenosylmethionine hydrolase
LKLISFTSDFGVQSHGVGIMEGTAISIAPDARIIHLMHGLPEFNLMAAARTLETSVYLPVGFHVCVCDPGVGTERRAIACRTRRGDHLVGPDNGILMAAARRLNGIEKVHELTNPDFMRHPVSPIFHGRDVFAPAAAHLANGVDLGEFGPSLDPLTLVASPYDEATIEDGRLKAYVIQTNRFGSVHLNVLHEDWDATGLHVGSSVRLKLPPGRVITVTVAHTFGSVAEGEPVILKDECGRVEVAVNRGSFAEAFGIGIGDQVEVLI